MTPAYERSLKRVSKRSWPAVVEAWAPFISALDSEAFANYPNSGVRDLPGLKAAMSGALGKEAEARIHDLASAPSHLQEAVFLVHKATNILVAAQDQAVGGLPTWSLATAYQAALFGAMASNCLLGVTLHAYVRESFLLDFFPAPSNELSKKALASYQIGTEAQVIKFESTVSHYHHWGLFRRLLRTTDSLNFDSAILQELISVEDVDFARQRNDLHYGHVWKFDDLHEYKNCDELSAFTDKQHYISMLEPSSSSFGLVLAVSVVSFAIKLLGDLAKLAPILQKECQRIEKACSMPRMKLRQPYEIASENLFIQ